MRTSPNQGSARIYQFPAEGKRYAEANTVSETPRVHVAMCSDNWYHDEAIREAQSQAKPRER